MKHRVKFLTAACVMAFSVTANAEIDWNAVMADKGGKVVDTFKNEAGFSAMVVESAGQRRIFYVTPDGGYLFSGSIYDAAGRNLSREDLARAGIGGEAAQSPSAAQTPASAKADEDGLLSGSAAVQQFAAAESLAWIEEGSASAKNVAYIVFDAKCPYCHEMYRNTRSLVSDGSMRIRWIPVGLLHPESGPLGMGVLESKNPQMLGDMFAGRGKQVSNNGELNVQISKNLLFLRDIGYRGVPYTIYQRADGIVQGEGGALSTAQIRTKMIR